VIATADRRSGREWLTHRARHRAGALAVRAVTRRTAVDPAGKTAAPASSPQAGTAAGSSWTCELPAIWPTCRLSRTSSVPSTPPVPAAQIGQMCLVEPVQHPPRRRHRRHRPEQVLPVAEHAYPTDRVGSVSDRDRQVGEDPPRGMQRDTLVGADHRSRHRIDQTGVLGHLAEQADPGMRHHALTVRADHDPTYPLATLHFESARPLGVI